MGPDNRCYTVHYTLRQVPVFHFCLCSPLIRNQKNLQAELRDEMLEKLDMLEKKLLKQIRRSVSVPDIKSRQVLYMHRYF